MKILIISIFFSACAIFAGSSSINIFIDTPIRIYNREINSTGTANPWVVPPDSAKADSAWNAYYSYGKLRSHLGHTRAATLSSVDPPKLSKNSAERLLAREVTCGLIMVETHIFPINIRAIGGRLSDLSIQQKGKAHEQFVDLRMIQIALEVQITCRRGSVLMECLR